MKNNLITKLVVSVLSLGVLGFYVFSIPERHDTSEMEEAFALSEVPSGSISGDVLGEKDDNPIFFTVNVPSRFKKNISAPNIVYSVSGGTGIEVTEGQSPTISNTGVLSLQELTGELLLESGDGISINGLEVSNTLSFVGSGGTTIERVGDAVTVSSSTPDYTLSGWAKVGTSVGLTTVTDSVAVDTLTFGNATITNGKSLRPDTDLGSDLGSASLRFNNLWVANINSNSSQSFSGQTTFSYAPTDTTISQASVLINPTTSAGSGQLLGLGVAGYQRALIDSEGDLTLGYSSATSAPSTDVPLNIYGHSGTRVSFIDTGGNGYFAGNVGIGTPAPGGPLTIRDTGIDVFKVTTNGKIYFSWGGSSLSNSGLSMTAVAINIGGGGNTSTLTLFGGGKTTSTLTLKSTSGVGTTGADIIFQVGNNGATEAMRILNNGNVGIGIDTPIYPLHVAGAMRLNSYLETSSSTNIIISATGKRILGFVTDDVTIDPKLAGADILLLTTQAGGNVGIGTDAPATKLDIASGSIILDYGFGLMLGAGGNGIYGDTADIKFASYGHSRFYIDNNNNDSSNFEVYGNVSRSTVAGALFTIEDTGNVGIGIDNPSKKLNVAGDIIAFGDGITITSGVSEGAAGSNNGVYLESDGGNNRSRIHTSNAGNHLRLEAPTAGADVRIMAGNEVVFYTNNATPYSLSNERMRIDSDGNVGIGTNNPGAALDIYGKIQMTSAGNIYSDIDNDGQGVVSAGFDSGFVLSGGVWRVNRTVAEGFGVVYSTAGSYVTDAAHKFMTMADILTTTDSTLMSGVVTFAPTSGTGKFIGLNINPTINQTGTATGDYTALQVNAVETAATGTNKLLADFQTGGASKMVITSDGNVGIGYATPGYKLVVNGDAQVGELIAVDLTTSGNTGLTRLWRQGLRFGSALNSNVTIDFQAKMDDTATYDLVLTGDNARSTATTYQDGGDVIINGGAKASGGGTYGDVILADLGGMVGIGIDTPAYSLDVTGMMRATEGIVMYTKAGTISDTDFTETPIDGLMGIDSTNGRLYFRHGGAWHYVAQTAGFQIPEYETFTYDFNTSSFDTSSPLANGDFLIPFVEGRMSDGAIHGLYTSFSDVKDQLFADELSRILSLEERVTALEAGGGLSTNPLLSSTGSIGSIATWADNLWTFLGKIKVGRDTAGSVVATTGTTTVQYDFDSTYPEIPAVYLTPMDSVDGSFYVKGISTTSFTVEMSQAQDHDVTFNWLAIIGSN